MLCLCRIFYFARQPFFAYFEAISQLLADNSGAADLAHIPPPHREGSAVGHLLRFLEKSSLMVLAFQFPGRTVQEFGTPISAWGVGGLNPHPPHLFCLSRGTDFAFIAVGIFCQQNTVVGAWSTLPFPQPPNQFSVSLWR